MSWGEDHVPILKLFNPTGAATWLAAELDADGDTMFGLVDLGLGHPELGWFGLAELSALRLPFGLVIGRDSFFRTEFRLSASAEAARAAGSIAAAEQIQAAVRSSGRSP